MAEHPLRRAGRAPRAEPHRPGHRDLSRPRPRSGRPTAGRDTLLLRVEFQFNAAHRLPLYEGPCFHTHGHNYKLVVLVEGPVDPKTGLSIDFVRVKELVGEHVLAAIDHSDLNQVLDNPTAENVVTWMWGRLRDHLPGLRELQLWETDDSAVIYRGEPVAPGAAIAQEAAPR